MKAQRSWLRPCTLVYLAMIGLTLVTFSVGAAGLSGLGVSLTVLASISTVLGSANTRTGCL